ncbi:hypothetical protein H0H81_003842 [Sphagnurus paluster]|uniref:SPX domain-containing protein n=1 Tax=Sphagnurus paluster TaxID=117069 RepID=A0A9P7KLI2_9AGAR|nr:hypothetical protein H0H81_003842 [Sphagnurus paluster]
MKFSSSLKFNAVSDWWDEYIAYDALKKTIYQLERQQTDDNLPEPFRDVEAGEQDSLLGQVVRSTTDALFEPLLNKELAKIVEFYRVQEKELQEELVELEALIAHQEEDGLAAEARYMDDPDADDDDEDDDDSISRSPEGRRRRKVSSNSRRNILTGSIYDPVEPSRPHRLSISSVDTVDGDDAPRSPTTMARLASTFGTLKDSFTSAAAPDTIWTSHSDYAYDTRLLFKRKITTLYVAFSNLKSYVEVNQSGFRKILKKYDKVTYSELKDRYMHHVVEHATPFTQESKDRLNGALQRLADLYTRCVTSGDRQRALNQLKLHQRENIAWERDTVWRQMIAQQRRGDLEDEPTEMGVLYKKPGPGLFFIPTPLGTIRVTKKMIYKIGAGVLFTSILVTPVVEGVEANRCFAILIFCTFLWATEAIALFVTSMFVPLLLVVLQVVRDGEKNPLSRPEATKYVFANSPPFPALADRPASVLNRWVFSIMFSPTIMLLIGGFTIASALSKTNIDRVLITKVLSLAGSRPSTVLLAFMGVSCFASMWIRYADKFATPRRLRGAYPQTISATSPPPLSVPPQPILRNLPPKSAFGPCLILAIALAANIGGQSSPISSPQNLIALHEMDPKLDWARWFAVALPVSAISIVLIWLMLLVSYKPARAPDGEGDIEIKQIRATKEPFTPRQWWVSIVCVVTIGLWCVAHQIEQYIGDMGVIAIIPIVAFFSTGVLKKDDFEQFAWTIVFLAMGGIALGKGVMSSGLLDVVDATLRESIHGLSLYSVILILSPVVLIISTFISHTIASVLLVPIAKEMGQALPGQPKNLLIFITALICSAGMGMPVSGFPNQTALVESCIVFLRGR